MGQGWVGARGKPGWSRTPSTSWLYADPKTTFSCTFPGNTKYFTPKSSFLEGFLSLQSTVRAPKVGLGFLPFGLDRKGAPAKETSSRSLQAAPAQRSPSTLPRAPAFPRPPQLGAGRN